MLKQSLLYLSVVCTLFGCELKSKETTFLRLKLDSLKAEIEASYKTTRTLQEIGILMDSIDAGRSALKVKMIEGTAFGDFAARMRDISKYVKEAELSILSLERKLTSSKNSIQAYSGAIKRLRHDLETRNQELAVLQTQVNRYRNANDNLVQTVSLQKAEITDKLSQIEEKQQEVAKLESQVKELIMDSKLDEAEAYFARARALEESANRTKFAPRKKRETKKEALELYKMAVSFGKEEAKEKVTELEKII